MTRSLRSTSRTSRRDDRRTRPPRRGRTPTPPMRRRRGRATAGARGRLDGLIADAETPTWSRAEDAVATRPSRRHRGARRRAARGPSAPPPPRPLAPCPAARRRARSDDDSPYATPWEELADAYESLPAEDARPRRVYLLKIVEVWEKGQKDIERALGALERAFRLDMKDAEVRARARTHGRRRTTSGTASSASTSAPSTSSGRSTTPSRCTTTSRALRERLGQTDKAEELYRAILRLKSDDTVALARVEEMCRDRERWEDLANVLEKRTSGATEALPPGAERPRAAARAGDPVRGAPRAPYEAIDTLERCCPRRPRKSAPRPSPANARTNAELLRPTRRSRACIRASACGPRSSRACSGRPS